MTSKVTHTKDSKDGLKKRTAQLLVYCNVSIRLMKTVEGKICWDVEDFLEDFLCSTLDFAMEEGKNESNCFMTWMDR